MKAIWYVKSNIWKLASWFYYENSKIKIFDVAFLILLSVCIYICIENMNAWMSE